MKCRTYYITLSNSKLFTVSVTRDVIIQVRNNATHIAKESRSVASRTNWCMKFLVMTFIAVLVAMSVCLVCQSTNSVQTATSQQISDGLPWNFVQTFMVPQHKAYADSVVPLTFPLAPPWGSHFWFWVKISSHHRFKISICSILWLN